MEIKQQDLFEQKCKTLTSGHVWVFSCTSVQCTTKVLKINCLQEVQK